ncbi:fructosamine-3-kinase [Rhodovulum imhoffii]|uniref:Fructosamine-3-kinase n=1 Tax=Rhodovulum imhoffii TaxID=365340 RepID=A0A2T5BR24_9RHOB|nr:fructosamine kinase family protein [Rhodovulum imhoffii]MBK5934970.1 aminoglycoside phosphotransferase [Rhodovulum imhoffii]PTN01679.1 fructosamine-3-kinase [Rhodovulum imhoffii]
MPDRPEIEAGLGPVARITAMRGGDLSQVFRVELADGSLAVAKTGPLVAREARMLRAMARAGAPCPRVLSLRGNLLLMEHLAETPTPRWNSLGAALRTLHARIGTTYGWEEDYAFGPARLPNTPCADWPEFWATRRLLAWPEALPMAISRRVERLCARICGLLPRTPPPALLHGDLWAGNVLFTRNGAALIDPACYHGDPEADLAMLHLFGQPGAGFADGYGALPEGWPERRPIYQIWPALVHLRLFGESYRGLTARLLDAAGA